MRGFRIAGLGAMKRSFASWVCALCLLVAGATGASAGLVYTPDRTPEGTVFLTVSGVFAVNDDLSLFSDAVASSHAQIVAFDSPGGDIYKALELGRLIRRLGLDTIQSIRLQCASACAFAFLGGVMRYAEPGSIGVHKGWFVDAPDDVDSRWRRSKPTADVVYRRDRHRPGADRAALSITQRRPYLGSEMENRVNTPEYGPVLEAAVPLPAPPGADKRCQQARGACIGSRSARRRLPGWTNGADGTARFGTVVWSLVRNRWPGRRRAGSRQAVIPATACGRHDHQAQCDRTVPASRAIEMIFTMPENFGAAASTISCASR